jgi:hypothetical protein
MLHRYGLQVWYPVQVVDVCSFVRHRLCPPGWQRMGDVTSLFPLYSVRMKRCGGPSLVPSRLAEDGRCDFVVPSVFSEDVTMKIVGSLWAGKGWAM